MERTFGCALRELRRSKGISQRNLAEKVGVDFSYISKIENDRLPPPAADTIVNALSGKIPKELEETIGSSPAAMQFIRSAQSMGLTEEEWRLLTRQLRQLRS